MQAALRPGMYSRNRLATSQPSDRVNQLRNVTEA